jgi:hypothetical protein
MSFGVVDANGVVGWLRQLVHYAYVTPYLYGSSYNGIVKQLPVYYCRARESKQYATGFYIF